MNCSGFAYFDSMTFFPSRAFTNILDFVSDPIKDKQEARHRRTMKYFKEIYDSHCEAYFDHDYAQLQISHNSWNNDRKWCEPSPLNRCNEISYPDKRIKGWEIGPGLIMRLLHSWTLDEWVENEGFPYDPWGLGGDGGLYYSNEPREEYLLKKQEG